MSLVFLFGFNLSFVLMDLEKSSDTEMPPTELNPVVPLLT